MFSRIVHFVAKTTNKHSSFATSIMSESLVRKKYDGRVKKRKWEERRLDKGAAFDVKKAKETDEENSTTPYERIKRRKHVLLLSYSGQNYFGMQRNPAMKTVEEDLFNALLKSNYITAEAFDQIQTIQFQRAARTDKGVSAARQVVSMKLPEEVDIDKINKDLPEVIRVFGVKRVTKGFNSKTQCDARTYNYMLPTKAFSKEECKVENFRLSDEMYDKINDFLKIYLGTKNYHNFTIKKKPKDPSAKRYIYSFECGKPFLSNGIEWAVLKVKGQSFMMHQIRKMVSLLIAFIRGTASQEIIDKAFTDEKINISKAPGLGLFLDFVHYDRYNTRYGSDGVHSALTWDEESEKVEEFKKKYIYPTIVETEIKENSMFEWLEKLDYHAYDAVDEEDTNDDDMKNGDDDEENGNSNGELTEKTDAVI